MDASELILNQSVSPPAPLQTPKNPAALSEAQKKQAAKNFESVLLNKLLERMNSTTGNWGFEKDAAAKQIDGLFSFYMSRHIADQGGFGLWKDVYQFLSDMDNSSQSGQSVEGSA